MKRDCGEQKSGYYGTATLKRLQGGAVFTPPFFSVQCNRMAFLLRGHIFAYTPPTSWKTMDRIILPDL